MTGYCFIPRAKDAAVHATISRALLNREIFDPWILTAVTVPTRGVRHDGTLLTTRELVSVSREFTPYQVASFGIAAAALAVSATNDTHLTYDVNGAIKWLAEGRDGSPQDVREIAPGEVSWMAVYAYRCAYAAVMNNALSATQATCAVVQYVCNTFQNEPTQHAFCVRLELVIESLICDDLAIPGKLAKLVDISDTEKVDNERAN